MFSVIHGHFYPDDFLVPDASYVTVFRDPFERTRSHFDDRRKWRGVVAAPEAERSYEEFALSQKMVNFQTKRINGRKLEFFNHVGITEELDKYVRYFDKSGKATLPNLNQTRERSETTTDASFLEKFNAANKEDIELYHSARKRVRE